MRPRTNQTEENLRIHENWFARYDFSILSPYQMGTTLRDSTTGIHIRPLDCMGTCLCNPLITHFQKPASFTTGRLFVRPRDLFLDPIALHLGEQLQQGLFQFAGVIHRKIAPLVMDDSIRWTFAVGLVNKETIGCQLINMGVIWRFRCAPGFHFDWDDLSILLDEIIGFTGQFEGSVEERFLQLAPTARVGIDDASTT